MGRCALTRRCEPSLAGPIQVSAGEIGLTVIELLITVAIIATMSSIMIPELSEQVEEDKNKQAASDIAVMAETIMVFINDFGIPPDNLAQVGLADKRDPWGNPYEYLNVFSDGNGPPHPRKDHFLNPLNSDFDLYSRGADGDTKIPLTAKASRDDILRANDGGYIGIASEY